MVLPLLLLAALLSTNALWWHSDQENQRTLRSLETRLDSFQSTLVVMTSPAPKIIVTHDTIWKVVYVQAQKDADAAPNQFAKTPDKNPVAEGFTSKINSNQTQSNPPALNIDSNLNESPIAANNANETGPANTISSEVLSKIANFEPLELPNIPPLAIPLRQIQIPALPTPVLPVSEARTIPITKKVAHALHPKFYKAGISAGWLNAASKHLMHEGGISYNLHAEIGFSRHWSLIADFGIGKMHYKAHNPEAMVGSPELPMPPSTGHHYSEMDVTGQRIRQYGIGLRHTFSQLGKSHPFLGISWGGQNIRPFSIQYEIQHEPSGTIEKAVYDVSTTTPLNNLFGINAGFEISLSSRINFIMQGFYQRQWKKNNPAAPDFRGVRAGITLNL